MIFCELFFQHKYLSYIAYRLSLMRRFGETEWKRTVIYKYIHTYVYRNYLYSKESMPCLTIFHDLTNVFVFYI
jgi:hypothetical protein